MKGYSRPLQKYGSLQVGLAGSSDLAGQACSVGETESSAAEAEAAKDAQRQIRFSRVEEGVLV